MTLLLSSLIDPLQRAKTRALALPDRLLDVPVRLDRPLATECIVGHLQFTDTSVWAWYLLDELQWDYLGDGPRAAVHDATTFSWSQLAGHAIRLRMSSYPFDVVGYAREYAADNPRPLPEVPGAEESFRTQLVRDQTHLRARAFREAFTALGVRLCDAPKAKSLQVWRDTGEPTRDMVAVIETEQAIAAHVAGAGLEARALTGTEMTWLMHRSLAPGVEAPEVPDWASPVWEANDLAMLTDPVEWEATPFGRTVRVTVHRDSGPEVRYVAVLTMGRMEDQRWPENGRQPWLHFADSLGTYETRLGPNGEVQRVKHPFPVEVAVSGEIVTGQDLTSWAEYYRRRAEDIESQYQLHGETVPQSVGRTIGHAAEIHDEVSEGNATAAARFVGVIRFAVAGATPAEALERARALVTEYGKTMKMQVGIQRDPVALREFIPGEPWDTQSFERRMKLAYLAAGVPNVSGRVGTPVGARIGYTCGSAPRVVLDHGHYVQEGYRTAAGLRKSGSGLRIITGKPGSGKTTLLELLAYLRATSGVLTSLWDPSGPMARLCDMPELAPYSLHIDLAGGTPGMLNPYRLVPVNSGESVEDAETERRELVIDTFLAMLPFETRHESGVARTIRRVVNELGGDVNHTMWDVLRRLNEVNVELADEVEHLTRTRTGRLVFGTEGKQAPPPAEEPMLLVVTMAGMRVPKENTDPRGWSTSERLALPVMNLGLRYTSRRIYSGSKARRKSLFMDEGHVLGDWGSSGTAFASRLSADIRKWTTEWGFASQASAAVKLIPNAKVNAGSVMVGLQEDDDEAASSLQLLGIPPDCGYEEHLLKLDPGEFIYLDYLRRRAKFQIDVADDRLLEHLDPKDEAAKAVAS